MDPGGGGEVGRAALEASSMQQGCEHVAPVWPAEPSIVPTPKWGSGGLGGVGCLPSPGSSQFLPYRLSVGFGSLDMRWEPCLNPPEIQGCRGMQREGAQKGWGWLYGHLPLLQGWGSSAPWMDMLEQGASAGRV